MSFQIRKNGEPLNIKALDQEAADFYKVPVDPTSYASHVILPDEDDPKYLDMLQRQMGLNWFERIGGSIHFVGSTTEPAQPEVQLTWDAVRKQMIRYYVAAFMKHNKTEEEATKMVEEDTTHNKPLLDLTRHWEGKGYVPYYVS